MKERRIIMIATMFGLFFAMGLGAFVTLCGIGFILLGDLVFKTNSGRRLIREWFEIKPKSN